MLTPMSERPITICWLSPESVEPVKTALLAEGIHISTDGESPDGVLLDIRAYHNIKAAMAASMTASSSEPRRDSWAAMACSSCWRWSIGTSFLMRDRKDTSSGKGD